MLFIKVAVRRRGRLSQIGVSRNSFRSSSTAEYSAVVIVAIFAVRHKFWQFEVRAFSSLRMLSVDPWQIGDSRPRPLTAGVVDCRRDRRESQSVQCRKSEPAACADL